MFPDVEHSDSASSSDDILGSTASVNAVTDERIPLRHTSSGILNQPPREFKDNLPLWKQLVFGFPSFPFSVGANFFSVYNFVYYSDVVKLNLNDLNVAYIVCLFFALLAFPLLGWAADRTHTRWGRRRPWIVVLAPLLFACITCIWMTPSYFGHFLESHFSKDTLGMLYYTLTYGSSIILMYAVQTPYMSLGVEMCQNFDQRSSLFGFSQGFYIAGMVVATGLPEFTSKYCPDTRMLYIYISSVTGVIGTLSFWLMSFILKESPDFVQTTRTTPLISGVRACLIENRPFLILLLAVTLQNSAPYTLSLLPYWVKYTLQLSDLWGSIIMSVFIASGFIFVPVWNLVARWWGKRKAYMIQLWFSVAGWTVLAFADRFPIWLVVLTTIFAGMSGIFLTGMNFLYQSLQGDVMDYDELRTGFRREATYNNVMQYFNWYMSVFSSTLPFLLMSLAGYNANTVQTPHVRSTIGILVASPAIASVLSALVMLKYPITKQKYYQILAGIQKHQNGQTALDPITNERIPPHSLKTEKETDNYWLMYSFSFFELRRGIRRKSKVRVIILLLITWWSLLFAGACVGWHYLPDYYYVWGYTAMLALTFMIYNFLRLKEVQAFIKNPQIDSLSIIQYLSRRDSHD
eukprot:TRINITY_DN7111_c0_g1_i1.p1 TRINITY_DN7111_c0_g1~~TRINITY_DN7111_c0_g1_i1.p1  ORF type:complete len:632 (-),score=97.87 TRINITY_DN7111_c0_g1_i1:31-1926(-)